MDKKKKIITAVSVSAAAVVVIAVVIAAVYALPFLKLGQAFTKPSEQPEASASEDAGSYIEETVTDDDGNSVTKEDGEPVTATRENTTALKQDSPKTDTTSGGSGTSKTTTEGHTADKQTTTASSSSAQTERPSSASTSAAVVPSSSAPAQPAKPSSNTTTKPASTTAPSTTQATTAAQQMSEYDIYRSGRFYAKGTAIDADGVTTPLELAVTPNTVYMISQIDGVNIGILINGKKSYMMYEDKKKYCELNSVLMNAADLDPEEMIATAKESYAGLEPLNKAARLAEGNVNGYPCKTYHFRNEEHELTTVSISGTKLVQVSTYDKNGRIENTINFTSVSADVPQSKIEPPKDYKKTGMVSFLMELSSAMGVDLSE